MKLTAVVVSLSALAACNGPSAPPLPNCSAVIPSGATASVGPQKSAACTEAGVVAIAAASDLSADGYTTVGPAMAFTATGPFPHGVDFVLPYTTAKVKSSIEDQVVVLAQHGHAPAHAAAVSNIVVENGQAKVHFHATDVATFQVAVPTGAGVSHLRHFVFRAIGGVSMGGFGSSLNFWEHPERYDAIGVMGADPGPDFTYDQGMIHDLFLGGFCTAADAPNKIGQLCPPARALLSDQGELGSSFEAFPYQDGAGVGLTLRRNLYIRANRDLARALGNAFYANSASPYLPPGVTPAYLARTNADVCANPIVIKKFFDGRYNPTGAFDVITFCDGNDSDAHGLGKFDPSVPATNPVQILLAVDVNGNGKRDSGEPVIVQAYEPFRDVGTDGKADKDEPGYDAATNPDPNGDDYHYLWNPTGTEGNWRYDQGEPFDDVGIDGVPMAVGGCPASTGTPGCFDSGEGNGKFDYNPGLDSWRRRDPRSNIEAMSAADLARIDVYYDAGIRDFFNTQVSTNSLMAALTAKGAPVRLVDGFPTFFASKLSNENIFDINKIDFAKYGRRLYVRYGDPDQTPDEVVNSGDGRHVGTVQQAIHRAQTLFYFLGQRWTDGDRLLAPVDSMKSTVSDTFTLSTGRDSPYVVILPPGYFQPENAAKSYPVVYFGHGLGMDPSGLAMISVVAQNAMVDTRVDDAHRLPKFIMVIVDGKCRPGGEIGNAPLPLNGDLCEEGAFYTDHPEGPYKMESGLIELEDHIDKTYRTRAPADLMVTE